MQQNFQEKKKNNNIKAVNKVKTLCIWDLKKKKIYHSLFKKYKNILNFTIFYKIQGFENTKLY